MAVVHFSSGLSDFTSGIEKVIIDVPRVHELFEALVWRFPALRQQLDGMAVAIDGEIYPDAEYEALSPESEVYFVPKMAGG